MPADTARASAPHRHRRPSHSIVATLTLRLDATQQAALLRAAGGDPKRRAEAVLRLVPGAQPLPPPPAALPSRLDAACLGRLAQIGGAVVAAGRKGVAIPDDLVAEIRATVAEIRRAYAQPA